MTSRSRLEATARLAVLALLFAQAALAAAACDALRMAPAQAFAAADEPSCHEQPARNSNLCLAHCLNGDQSGDTPQVVVPACSATVVLWVAVDDFAKTRETILRHALPRTGAPPPRILFQTFLI